VVLSFSPLNSQHVVGDVFQLTITLSTGSQQVDGAETHITFDPTKLQVTDSSGAPATSITPGPTFEAVLQNIANNTTGRIDYSAGTFKNPLPSGNIVVATITFKALAATPAGPTSVSYSTSGRGTTSKVTLNGMAFPLTVNNATITITTPGGNTPILIALEHDGALPIDVT